MKKNYSYPVSSIGFTISELPGETAVYIEFSGCRQNCPGCHSDYLIGDQGDSLDLRILSTMPMRLPRSILMTSLLLS